MPGSWGAFRAYFDDMITSPRIKVGGPAIEIRQFLLRPPRRLGRNVWRWYGLMTAGFLPERIRDEYGFVFGRRERIAFEMSLRSYGSSIEKHQRAYVASPPTPRRDVEFRAPECRIWSARSPID